MKKIKIGIIGLGKAWERLHAPAYSRLTDKFQITAVCDTNINKAKSVAHQLGLPEESAYGDYSTMLSEADIEAVDTMVPIHENYECARAVIEHKKHLIAEKPFGSSVEAINRLITLKTYYGVKILVAENYRYDEENVLIKNLISENRIGNAVYFIDNYVTEFQREMIQPDTFSNSEWRKHPEFKGGIFLDSGIHHIARHRFLFGKIKSIFANGRHSEVDFSPYSCINALLTFENSIAGHYSFYAIGKETQAPLVGLRIFGTGGEIYLEDRECGFVNISYKEGHHETIPYTPNEGYYHELNNFFEGIRNNMDIVSTPEKELGDIEAIFGILESTETNQAVHLNDDFTPFHKGFRGSNPIAI